MLGDESHLDIPNQTKAYLDFLRTIREPTPLVVRERTFTVLPGVFLSGAVALDFFFRKLPLRDDQAFLEIGTGHGILPVLLHLERGIRVVGTDLIREAIRCARLNAANHGIAGKIDFRQGDLFGALREDERFDVIFWNPPVFGEKPADDLDRAVTSENYECLDRFLKEGRNWLREDGSLCVGFTSDADPAFLSARIAEYGYTLQPGSVLERTGKHPLLYILKTRQKQAAPNAGRLASGRRA